MEIDKREHPIALQLFGSDPDLISEVAKSIEDRPFDILDINMGCPRSESSEQWRRKCIDEKSKADRRDCGKDSKSN